jgi:hypothetical protein
MQAACIPKVTEVTRSLSSMERHNGCWLGRPVGIYHARASYGVYWQLLMCMYRVIPAVAKPPQVDELDPRLRLKRAGAERWATILVRVLVHRRRHTMSKLRCLPDSVLLVSW